MWNSRKVLSYGEKRERAVVRATLSSFPFILNNIVP